MLLARLHAGLDAASLLVSEGPDQAAIAACLTKPAQAKGIAVLIEYDTGLAKACGADGVMTGGSLKSWQAAKAALPQGAIVGGRCTSRHQAMDLAEAGADFVAFSDPALITWWAEIFQVPCVDAVPGRSLPEADFITPGESVWSLADAKNAP